jgi:uncharacterized protein with FMN-binding domain
MGNKMVALCSAAIGAIYMAGYFVTDQPVSAQTASAPTANSAPVASAGQGASSDQGQGNQGDQAQGSQSQQQGSSSASSSSSSAPTQTPAPSASTGQGKYKDGTYTGSGSNRIGTVEVAVTIKSDKITDVQITNCDTHYSEDRIADLPQQVLDRQSSDVDIVSGATKSTQDFATAVDECLQQALRNPS